MGLDSALASNKRREAEQAMDIACSRIPGKWSDLPESQRALAIASARANDQFLGLAGMVMAAGAFENLPEVFGDPFWQAAMAPGAQMLEHLRASLGQAFARYPLAREAISELDDAAAWLGVLGMSRPYLEMAHPSRAEKFCSLNGLGAHDDKAGNPDPFEPWQAPGKHGAPSDCEWKDYARELEAASSKVDAKLFERLPWLKLAAAGAIERAVALDSGARGPGAQKAAALGVESAMRILERGGGSPQLRELMFFWAASARRQSLAALEVCKRFPPECPGIDMRVADLDYSRRPRRYDLPERVDAAWLCASKAFDQDGVEAAIGLRAAFPCGDVPTALLSEPRQKMKHPLEALVAIWENAKRAKGQLPASAISSAMALYARGADELGEDWAKIRAGWDELAGQASSALLSREPLGGFPGGEPPNIHALAKSYRVPVSPLQWRLENARGNARDWERGLGSPGAIEHCALASAALGFPIEQTLAVCEISDKAVMSGVEAAVLRLATGEGGAKPKSGPRL